MIEEAMKELDAKLPDLTREQLIAVIRSLRERNVRQMYLVDQHREKYVQASKEAQAICGHAARLQATLRCYKRLFWHLYWRKS